MPSNDPSAPVQATARPRVRVLVNGTPLYAVTHAEVTNNNYYQADSFSAQLVVDSAIDAGSGIGSTFWCADPTGSSTNPAMVGIQFDPGTTQAPNWTTMISGRVDHIEFDPITRTLDIKGRDRSADLIEARTFETFKNQTSSQVATLLAQRHGLTPAVTATKTLVDRYYAIDHDKMTLGNFGRSNTEWDLLTFLAQNESFDVFVKDTTLYFQPEKQPTQSPFVVQMTKGGTYPSLNVIDLKLERSLTLARDIIVTVQSFNSRQKASFKVTAKATGTKATKAGASANATQSNTQTYVFTKPNMTHDQAQAYANAKLAELSAHERVVRVEIPGETALSPRTGLQVNGTGTDFDIAYYITEITRTISAEGGFSQTMTAKNQSPKNVTIIG